MKRFSIFSLDTDKQCLWRGQEAVHLSPKAYAVLSYLIEHADRLVSKEELLEALWPDTFVTDAVLKVNILEIRKALGETSGEPKHIVIYRLAESPDDGDQLRETFLSSALATAHSYRHAKASL